MKRHFWTYIILFAAALIFTILVTVVDSKPIGPEGGYVGFATINGAFHEKFGFAKWLYSLTEYAGYIPAVFAVFFAGLGVFQLLKRKDIKKVDTSLLLLAAFYVLVGAVYFGFELLWLNSRPVIIDEIEASYPSSHTFLTVCLCCSTILVNQLVYRKEAWAHPMNLVAIVFLIFVPLGRLFSGVHWLTDIIGGYLIGAALVALYNLFLRASINTKTKAKALD